MGHRFWINYWVRCVVKKMHIQWLEMTHFDYIPPQKWLFWKKKKKGFILVGTSCWNPALKDEIHSHVHKSDRIKIFYWQLSESLGLLTVSLLAIMEAAWIVSGSSVCCVAAWLISSVADVLILVYRFMNVIIVCSHETTNHKMAFT